jgi:N-acetylmuramoyl-L-alanine amidase
MIWERRHCLRVLTGALGPLLLTLGGSSLAQARARHRHAAPRPVHKHRLAGSATRHSRPVIVIDPGHGGIDPGTVGRSGTLEKTVTLQTALELARLLRASGRYQVLLTRDDDRFASLADRAVYGRAHGAALIISLHADASPDRSARGSSVYIRSNRAAGPGLKRRPSDLADMAQALGKPPAPQAGSAWLQYSIIDRLNDVMEMTPAPARAAHFWVLANQDIPGVLVEMGFLSNRQDETLMRNARHRLLIARLIRDAIDSYFGSIAHRAALQT